MSYVKIITYCFASYLYGRGEGFWAASIMLSWLVACLLVAVYQTGAGVRPEGNRNLSALGGLLITIAIPTWFAYEWSQM